MLFLISSKCRPITFKESPPSSKKSESIEINFIDKEHLSIHGCIEYFNLTQLPN